MLRGRRTALGMSGRRGQWRWISAALAASVALGSWSLCGCALKTHFPDMQAQLAALPIPEAYGYLYETRRGGKPPFFGDDPQVWVYYRSPDDPDRTCDTLASRLEDFVSNDSRTGWGCSLTLEVPSGWRARLWNVWSYRGNVTVASVRPERRELHPAEPREPYTRVAVGLADRG